MTRATRSHITTEEDQQARLIEGLRATDDRHAHHLADKLSRCRESREQMRAWGGRPPDLRAVLGKDGRYRCEHHACWSCRRSKVRAYAKKQAPRFCNADNDYCTLVTIADSVTGDLSMVRDRVVAMARAVRDRRDATVTAGRAPWRRVEVVGHVELDPYLPHDLDSLAPNQRALMPRLPVLAGGDGHMWIVRMHLAVRHDGIGREELIEVFGHQWPGLGRVHGKPFHDDKLAQENAGIILSYGIKHAMEHDVGEVSEHWAIGWQVEYWAWLHQMGRGLQPIRVSVGPQQLSIDPMVSSGSPTGLRGGDHMRPVSPPSVAMSSVPCFDDEYDDPLPMTFSMRWSPHLGFRPP